MPHWINNLKIYTVYDRNSKTLPQLHVNDNVRAQDPIKKTWAPGRKVRPSTEPRSYIIQTENGVYRINSKHVRRTGEDFDNIDIQINTDSNDAAMTTAQQAAENNTHVNSQSTASALINRHHHHQLSAAQHG